MIKKPTPKTRKPAYAKDLILLFAIPAGIALLAAAVVYIPRLMANPQYDFIYTACDTYYCKDSYSVNAAGSVTYTLVPTTTDKYVDPHNQPAKVYYYDVSDDSRRLLSLEEAQRYRLNTSSKSPDGYTLTHENTYDGFLFDRGNRGWYLQSGMKKKQVDVSAHQSYYSSNVTFLGWVTE